MERKTALITGASGGLGYEFAHIYAENGYDLVVVARSESKLLQLKKELEDAYGIRVWVFAQDLSKQNAAYEVYDFTMQNKIDIEILVNNAGFGDYGNFTDFSITRQQELLQVNIISLVELTRYFLPLMVKRKSGHVINMSSVAAFCAGPKMSLYYSSKAFVRSFSEAVAEEVKGNGVNVLALCPGPTATGFEKAADMTASKMFHFVKPNTAKEVAMAGYKASCRGKTLRYYGASVKIMNIAARLLPRTVTRKFAKLIN